VRHDSDLAVIGSGFAGSLVSLVARRLGRSVTLVERGSHPRFAIGESSSPLANILLETISDRYGLPRIRPLSRWGTWRRAYPGIGCGKKRGFTFYSHDAGLPFAARPDRKNELLVAASPRDEIADTHWYRPDFDHFLVREAEEAGAQYTDRTAIERIEERDGRMFLSGHRAGEPVTISARLVVDASGPRGFLFHALALGEESFEGLPRTEALYSHFRGVRRLDESSAFREGEETPYPIDDAAVHHVFREGWIWVLRFGNGITSAGVAATERCAEELGFREGAPAWDRLLQRLPSVAAQFAEARAILPFVHQPRLSFRSKAASGPGWTLLPSAAAFVDPLLSTGFPLTLLGIERLARALEEDWDSARFDARLAGDARRTLFESDTAGLLVAALYATFSDFPVFAALARLYFAAASYSEAARRLGRAELAGSFLCADRPDFGPAFVECCRQAILAGPAERRDPAWRESLVRRANLAIWPIDVAGLSDATRRNWFPVEARDLVRGAEKLRSTPAEVREMLGRSGIVPLPETPRRAMAHEPRTDVR
jgi:tetracycline 7-halogenase / FADH2 O2-dependent halogenase